MLSIILQPNDTQIWAAQILGYRKLRDKDILFLVFKAQSFTFKHFIDLNFLTHKNATYQCHVLEGHSYTRANTEQTQMQYYPSVHRII